MNIMNLLPSMIALSGISMISFGALWVKQYLKRSFCF